VAPTATNADTRKREATGERSRWPVTVAAVLAVIALLLVGFVALRKHRNEVFAFSGSPSEVIINSSAGLVVVVPADGDQVQVSRRAKWTLFKPDMDVGLEGGSLVVQADCVGPSFICDVQYRVSVPSSVGVKVVGGGGEVQIDGVGGPVNVQTSGGDVSLGHLSNAVKVRTTGGDISMDTISGAIDAAADSGSITGTSLTGPTIQSGTSSGDITLTVTGSSDRIGAGSGSGDIAIVVPDLGYKVDAKAGSPDDVHVDVNQSPDATRTITATTGSGQISITRG